MQYLSIAVVTTMITASGAIADTLVAEDRLAIVDAITSIVSGADRHDWDRVRDALADEVTLDYTSLWGGNSSTQPADIVIDQWSSFLPGFDETLHLVTNHTITDSTVNTANAEADFQALHRIDDAMWILFGHYAYQLKRSDSKWQVTHLKMTWTHEIGDRNLVNMATERAKEN